MVAGCWNGRLTEGKGTLEFYCSWRSARFSWSSMEAKEAAQGVGGGDCAFPRLAFPKRNNIGNTAPAGRSLGLTLVARVN